MKDQDSWDRYGAFYERRAKNVEAAVRRRPRWKKAAGWLAGTAFAVGFWWLFIWLGTRHWPH